MKITKNQLQELIKEEYDKIKKIKALESRKSQIVSQLNEMHSMEEGEIDEINLGSVGRALNLPGSLEAQVDKAAKQYGVNVTDEEKQKLVNQLKKASAHAELVQNPQTGRLEIKSGGIHKQMAGAPGGGF